MGNLFIHKIAQEHRVFGLRTHPKFNEIGYDYDVAVIMVKGRMEGGNIAAVELSEAPLQQLFGKVGTVCGFGKLSVIPRI